MGGLMSVTGQPDGLLGGEPMKVGVAVSDIVTGLYTTIAILAAIVHQTRTGEGQQIDMALFDCQAAALANQAMNYLAGGMIPTRLGNSHPNIVPYQVFATNDGFLVLAIANDEQFQRFCKGSGQDALASDPRFVTNHDRVRNRDVLVPLMLQLLRERSTAQWITLLEAANVPCGPINRIDEVFADQQAIARQLTVEMHHPAAGPLKLVASPLRLSKTPAEYRLAPPRLGQDTGEILQRVLGLDPAEIASLRSVGVIG